MGKSLSIFSGVDFSVSSPWCQKLQEIQKDTSQTDRPYLKVHDGISWKVWLIERDSKNKNKTTKTHHYNFDL